jgi:hypothetical protein
MNEKENPEKDFQNLCEPDRIHDITPEGVAQKLTETLVDPHERIVAKPEPVAETVSAVNAQAPVVPKVEGAGPVLTIGLDPLTAGFNAAAALFNLLSTTQGQVVMAQMIALDEFFVKKVQEIFEKIHDQVQKA